MCHAQRNEGSKETDRRRVMLTPSVIRRDSLLIEHGGDLGTGRLEINCRKTSDVVARRQHMEGTYEGEDGERCIHQISEKNTTSQDS